MNNQLELSSQEILKTLSTSVKNGRQLSLTDKLSLFRHLVELGQVHTMEPLLPVLLRLKGTPYTLEDHFPFAPMFRTRMPQNLAIVSGRQCSKSTSLAANGVIVSNAIPYFSTLYVTPLYEQIRRLSNNYVRPFIDQSPVKSLWVGTTTENNILQRSFKNESRMHFTFAFLDAERVRGFSADRMNIDEVQDMDPDLLPVIREVMSHSKWSISWYTGTPKTEENTINTFWKRSSQAQWFCHCRACGFWNIPSREFHILDMIGPLRDDISENAPGIICTKCRASVNPRWPENRWVHKYPERRWDFAGYHIPQIIMPIHYAFRKKWSELLGKQRGAGNFTKAKFFNEVLGETFDEATKLVTEEDLRKAASLQWRNDWTNYSAVIDKLDTYQFRCLAVDWGGGGEDETSFTTLAVLGWKGNGSIDCLWGKRLLTPHDHLGEARACLQVFNDLRCHFFVHDYTGAGALRETFMHHAGIPTNKLVPVAYVRAASRDLMSLHAATRQHPRDYHVLDKARSLQLTCNCIKLGVIRFFQYDHINEDEPGLLHDFLALIENKVETSQAGDIYTIVRNPMFKDDFAQAVNIGCCALWHATGSWPNLAMLSHLQMSAAQLSAASPIDRTWAGSNDMGGFLGQK